MFTIIRAIEMLRAYVGAPRRDEKGASAVEYGLLVALIAAVIVTAVLALGGTLIGIFTDTNDAITVP